MNDDVWIWRIQNSIKNGEIEFKIGETVSFFSKRADGYPRNFNIGDEGIVISIQLNHLICNFHDKDHISMRSILKSVKIPKKYLANKSVIRDYKLRKILNNI